MATAVHAYTRRRALATLPWLAAGLAGCQGLRHGAVATAQPTPLPPRSGDPDEVRLGVFDPAPPTPPRPPSPLERLLPLLSGTAPVGGLHLRVQHLPSPANPIDPDTHRFQPPRQKLLTVELLFIHGTLAAAQWPDLVVLTDLDQMRDSARRGLILPLDRYLTGLPGLIVDPWPGAEQVFHDRGRAWGVPVALQPLVLTYQPGFFHPPAGSYALPRPTVPLPTSDWTWDDLLKAAKQLSIPPPPRPNPLLGAGPDQTRGAFGFFATAPDSLPVFVWQADGSVVTGQGQQARCALETPAARDGQRFLFDLIHRDQASPRQTPDGHWSGSAAMQLGPATGVNFVLPPRGKERVTGYSLSAATGLAVAAWARDPERAVRAALGMAAAAQGQYDWPVSRSAAAKRAEAGGPAATAVAALRLVQPPGLVADVRDVVETGAIAIANAIVTPSAATLNDVSLVKDEASSACAALNQALRALP